MLEEDARSVAIERARSTSSLRSAVLFSATALAALPVFFRLDFLPEFFMRNAAPATHCSRS
jgi:hypothetical protein